MKIKIFPFIALLATFCAIYHVQCQIIHTSVCDDALEGEMLLEYRTQNLSLISAVVDLIGNETASDSSFTDADKQEIATLITTFRTSLNSFGIITIMTNTIYGELMTYYKPILQKVCTANLGPCGTFIPYNSVLDQTSLIIGNAYYAGKYRDSTPAYIGGAFMQGCSGERYVPARCQNRTFDSVNNVYNNDPGCITTCGINEYRVINPVAYLQYNFDFIWKLANKDSAATVANAIKIKGVDSNGFYIGRIQLNDATLGAYTQVGKVYIDNDKNNLVYVNEAGAVVEANDTFEVLTCLSPPLDNSYVLVMVYQFENNYTDGFDLSLITPSDARVLHSTKNWLLVITLCLTAWLYGENYQ